MQLFFKTLLDKLLANFFNRLCTTVVSLSNKVIRPTWTICICLTQDLSTADFLTTALQAFDHVV
ncbi:MAG: hypothetical protein AAFO08_01930 [Pseudomonadota bacterium]